MFRSWDREVSGWLSVLLRRSLLCSNRRWSDPSAFPCQTADAQKGAQMSPDLCARLNESEGDEGDDDDDDDDFWIIKTQGPDKKHFI